MVLLPKFLGILPFDQAHKGAEEAAKELKNPAELQFLGPTPREQRRRPDRDRHQRNDAGRQGDHDLQQLRRPDRAGGQGRAGQGHQGRDLGFADSLGRGRGRVRRAGRFQPRPARLWPTWRSNIIGPEGGKFAILSASPDAANQNAWIAAMKDGVEGPEIRQAQARRHRLRQRPVREELHPGAGAASTNIPTSS